MNLIFQKYSGNFSGPGDSNYMSKVELYKLSEDTKLTKNEKNTERTLNLCFNLAKESVVDEIHNERIL